MATFDRYLLRLAAPLHLGGRGIGIEATELTVRSDTLFSALVIGLQQTGGDGLVAELLDRYRQDDPPFVLSSSFPWVGETFLLPRPRVVPAGGPSRRARWVSEAVLRRLLRGEAPDDSPEPLDLGAESTAWLLPEERRALEPRRPYWAIGTVPRVTVDRFTQASAVYRAGRTVYGPEAGLHVLVLWRDRGWEPAFERALTYLADAGLGGERSAGYGQFRVERRETITIEEPVGATHCLTLGLYHPTESEVGAGALDPPAAYDLEVRRGWTTDPGAVWRKAVRMLAEGAVVQQTSPLIGDLVDVTPDGMPRWRIARCGVAPTLRLPADHQGGRRGY